MDLTHETYVHGSSIGQLAVAEAPFVATHGNRTATVTRHMADIDAPPFWSGQLKHASGYEGRVDRWQIIRFEAPCTIAIDVGVAPAGSGALPNDGGRSDRSKGVNGYVLNTITPETERSCHYFWAFSRNYCLGEQRLTHETFVHGSSIGNRAVAEAPFVATHGDRTATVTRWMEGIDAPPFWAAQIHHARGHMGPVDRWQIIRFEAPCTVSIDVGVAPAGSGAVPPRDGRGQFSADPALSDRRAGVNGQVLNTITPETDGSCHYFWAFARNYCLGEQALTHKLREGVASIFREDEHVLEAQQIAMDEHPDHQFYNLNIDAGSMWARKLIDKLIAREKPAKPVIAIRQAA
jgi:hypothetical protein